MSFLIGCTLPALDSFSRPFTFRLHHSVLPAAAYASSPIHKQILTEYRCTASWPPWQSLAADGQGKASQHRFMPMIILLTGAVIHVCACL